MTGSPFDKILGAPDGEILPSVQKFNRWLVKAQTESQYSATRSDMWGRKAPRKLREVAGAVWAAYEDGTVELVQRRNRQGTIDYLAIKRRHPR